MGMQYGQTHLLDEICFLEAELQAMLEACTLSPSSLLSPRLLTVPSLKSSHLLTIACTCCYNAINEIQDIKIYSHADSIS